MFIIGEETIFLEQKAKINMNEKSLFLGQHGCEVRSWGWEQASGIERIYNTKQPLLKLLLSMNS